MKKFIQSLLLVMMIAQLAACASSPKGEADQYNELRDSTIYKTYQKVSIEAMKPVIKEYDKKLAQENRPQVGAAHVHALLGLIWIASAQPEYAIAETETAAASASDPRDRYAILTLQSLALHEQGWHFIAKQKSVEAKALVQLHGLSNSYSNVLMLTHVAGSALALQEGNITYVANEVREVGSLTRQNWMVDLGDVTEEAYTGSHTKAIAKLEQLKNDSSLTTTEREGVSKVLAVAKAGGKDMPTEVAKAVVSVAVEEGIRSSALTPVILEELPEKYRDKLSKYL